MRSTTYKSCSQIAFKSNMLNGYAARSPFLLWFCGQIQRHHIASNVRAITTIPRAERNGWKYITAHFNYDGIDNDIHVGGDDGHNNGDGDVDGKWW